MPCTKTYFVSQLVACRLHFVFFFPFFSPFSSFLFLFYFPLFFLFSFFLLSGENHQMLKWLHFFLNFFFLAASA